ncbi:MAG: arginine--tRNA ligase [Nitrospiraceae bacterium]|nr:arginine--tRNA ligase [Nitrospiraceae bacterium]
MIETVREILTLALGALGIPAPERIEVEVPKAESMGDLATPLAMSLAKTLKRPPGKIAEEIVSFLNSKDIGLPDILRLRDDFEKIEVAGPGFINFTFKRESLYSSFAGLLRQGGASFRKDIGKGQKILVEFVSANPTGPLHLGHGRGAALGAALSNLLAASGFNVTKEYYVNDAGRQVGLLGESVFARYQELLGISYPFPEEGYRGEYVTGIARKIMETEGAKYKDKEFSRHADYFSKTACDMMLAAIKDDLESFGVTFDVWQSEKELYDKTEVEAAIDYLRGKGLIYEKEGATWFAATSFGDEKDRVLIKSGGQYTYFASDVAYHKKKADKGYDELIDIWGADHHGYIPRVGAALEALGYGKERLTVLLVQMVSLLRGGKPVQMSKRAGEFVTLREVIEEVGADMTKFIFLTRKADSHLDFDLEVAKAASAENPVYYVQYANARIGSIFRNAVQQGFLHEEGGADVRAALLPTDSSPDDLSPLAEPEEIRLLKKVLLYPSVLEAAVQAREPHRITYYLQELAGLFHPYYNRHRILTDERGLSFARLCLCRGIALVIRDGLRLLGVAAPEKM